jgi:hydroxypyruvate reductase 2
MAANPPPPPPPPRAPPENESSDLPQVLVLKPPPVLNAFWDHFTKRFQILKVWESPLPVDQFLATHARSVRALLCYGTGPPITAEIIRLLPSLRLVVTTSVGLNHIDLTECRRLGIAVADAGDVFSDDVADMAVGLLIDVLRKVSAADRYVRKGLWAAKGDYPLGSKVFFSRLKISYTFSSIFSYKF